MPGQYGDLLWSLATVQQIAVESGPVDFYTTHDYAGIVPLVQQQPYIANAYAMEEWRITGLVPGGQPWDNPPLPREYDHIYQLGYKGWPNAPLIDFIARSNGVQFTHNPLPFLTADPNDAYDIVFGISEIIRAIRDEFIEQFVAIVKQTVPDLTWINGSDLSWVELAEATEGSLVFVGDKSSMHVVAHGLDHQCIIEVEGNESRRQPTFCNPYNDDNTYRIESPNHYGVIDLVQPFAEAASRYLNGGNLHD